MIRGKKILLALMPLLVVLGLQGAEHGRLYTAKRSGSSSTANVSSSALPSHVSAGMKDNRVFLTGPALLPCGVLLYPSGHLQFPPTTLVCKNEGFAKLPNGTAYFWVLPTENISPTLAKSALTGHVVNLTNCSVTDALGHPIKVNFDKPEPEAIIGYTPPIKAQASSLSNSSSPITIPQEKFAGPGLAFPDMTTESPGIVATDYSDVSLPPAALDRRLGNADKVLSAPASPSQEAPSSRIRRAPSTSDIDVDIEHQRQNRTILVSPEVGTNATPILPNPPTAMDNPTAPEAAEKASAMHKKAQASAEQWAEDQAKERERQAAARASATTDKPATGLPPAHTPPSVARHIPPVAQSSIPSQPSRPITTPAPSTSSGRPFRDPATDPWYSHPDYYTGDRRPRPAFNAQRQPPQLPSSPVFDDDDDHNEQERQFCTGRRAAVPRPQSYYDDDNSDESSSDEDPWEEAFYSTTEYCDRRHQTRTIPLMAKGIDGVTPEEAEEIYQTQEDLRRLRWHYNIVPPREVRDAIEDFNKKYEPIRNFRSQHMGPESNHQYGHLNQEELNLLAANPNLAAEFNAHCTIVRQRELAAQAEAQRIQREREAAAEAAKQAEAKRIQAVDNFWNHCKTNIPPSHQTTSQTNRDRFITFWQEYEKQNETELGDDLKKAKEFCSLPFTETRKTCVPPPSATKKFQTEMAAFTCHDGELIGADFFERNKKQIYDACNTAKENGPGERWPCDQLDYAKNSPSIVLLHANLAQQTNIKVSSVAAIYMTQANEFFNDWLQSLCKTIYDSFGTWESLFAGSSDKARAERFKKHLPQNLRFYENLYTATRLFSKFLYHSALTNNTIKKSILSQEKWINSLVLTQSNTGFVAMDFIQKTCGATVLPATISAIKEHCAREDYFATFCKSEATNSFKLHGTKPLAYMYSQALKNALALIKAYEAAHPLPPPAPAPAPAPIPKAAPVPAPVPAATRPVPAPAQATTQPTPTPPPPPIVIVPVVVPDPAYTHIPPQIPEQATPGHGHSHSSHGQKRRATDSTTPDSDDEAAADDEEDDGKLKRVRPRSPQPSTAAATAKVPSIIIDDDEPADQAAEEHAKQTRNFATAHDVSVNNFSHTQELYVNLGSSTQAICTELAAVGRGDQAAQFAALSENSRSLAQAIREFCITCPRVEAGLEICEVTGEAIIGGISRPIRAVSTVIGDAYHYGAAVAFNNATEKIHACANQFACSLVDTLNLIPVEGMSALEMEALAARHQEVYNRVKLLTPRDIAHIVGTMIGDMIVMNVAGSALSSVASATNSTLYAPVTRFTTELNALFQAEEVHLQNLRRLHALELAGHTAPLSRSLEQFRNIPFCYKKYGAQATRDFITVLRTPEQQAALASLHGELPTARQLAIMRSSEAASLGAATSSGRGKSAAAATETSSAISKLKIDTEGLCDPASNKFNHIFDQSKHKLERIGGTPHEVLGKIIAVTERAATEGKLPAKGQFIIRDIIDGHQVEIRGAVVSGEVKYGTFFVDKDCC